MALPFWAYGDPAEIAESMEIRKKNCSVCARAEVVLDRPVCTNSLRFPSCRRDKKKGFRLLEVPRK